MLERKVVHAKIVGTIFGAGVKIEGKKGILLSSHTKDEEIKKRFENDHPELCVIWVEN